MADEPEKKEEGQDSPKGDEAAQAGGGKDSSKMGLIVVVVIGFLVMTLTPLITFFAVKMSIGTAAEPTVESGHGGKGKEGKSGHGGGHGGGEKGDAEGEEKGDALLDLTSIMVNIIETKDTRILRVNPHLLIDLKANAKLEEKLKTMIPMLKDKVMLAAKKKTIDELDGPEGQEALRREILAEINAQIRADKIDGAVINVFFSEFLIQ